MTIEEYCRKLNVDKEALSYKQIEEWGLEFCDGEPFYDIWHMGTEKDKRKAVETMRKTINEGGKFMWCYLLEDDCIEERSTIDLDKPAVQEKRREENFAIWIG